MKFIFDFDDVLFHTTNKFIKYKDYILQKEGVSDDSIKKYYEKEGQNLFSLKRMLDHLFVSPKLYEKIIKKSKDFTNDELLKIIKKIGKSNCFIVTYGDEEFQRDKIRRAGIDSLFSKIIVVSESKKDAVEKICVKHKDEKVIFIDDRAKHFEDLDMAKCPNLKTILFDERGLEKLKAEIDK